MQIKLLQGPVFKFHILACVDTPYLKLRFSYSPVRVMPSNFRFIHLTIFFKIFIDGLFNIPILPLLHFLDFIK